MKFRFWSVIVALAVAVLGTAPLTAQAPVTEGLAPGDQLRVVVWKNPDLSGDFVVAADGTIIHPLYRDIHVTGVPLSTIEDRLRTFLKTYLTDPQLVIQPLIRVVVAGEVRSPNVYTVAPETTVIQALATAGGPTDRGRLDRVRLIRGGQQQIINVSKNAAEVAGMNIRSGDQIVVPARRAMLPVVNAVVSSVGAISILYSVFFK